MPHRAALSAMIVMLATLQASSAFADDPVGRLEVLGPAGVHILLDTTLLGTTTTERGGVMIEGLAVGRHRLVAAQAGRQRSYYTVDIEAEETTRLQLDPMLPVGSAESLPLPGPRPPALSPQMQYVGALATAAGLLFACLVVFRPLVVHAWERRSAEDLEGA